MTVRLLCPSHADTAFNVQAASQSVEGTAVAQAVAARPFDTAVATVSKSAAAMPWAIHRAAVRGENRNTR